MWPDENWSFDEAEAHGFDGSGRGLYEPAWAPEPLCTRTVAILSFLVGFALCYLTLVP